MSPSYSSKRGKKNFFRKEANNCQDSDTPTDLPTLEIIFVGFRKLLRKFSEP